MKQKEDFRFEGEGKRIMVVDERPLVVFNDGTQYQNMPVLEIAEMVFRDYGTKACKKFMSWYELKLKTWEWSCSTNTIWTSFDHGEVQAETKAEALGLAIKQLRYDIKKVNQVLNSADVTSGFEIEFDFHNIEIKEKV